MIATAKAIALALVITNATSVKSFKGYVALVEVKAFGAVKMMAPSILIRATLLRLITHCFVRFAAERCRHGTQWDAYGDSNADKSTRDCS